jgi:hypothetical protein
MEGNQKPMEEEEPVSSAATSKRVLIRSTDESLEVEPDPQRFVVGLKGERQGGTECSDARRL